MKIRELVLSILSTLVIFNLALAEPSGCPDFEVELPRAADCVHSAVVRAVDFGLSETNTRNHVAINAAIAEAKRTNADRVELAPGTYRCFDGKGIFIDGFTDFTFDGKGATLVFRRNKVVWDNPVCKGLPYAGKTLVEGAKAAEEVGNAVLLKSPRTAVFGFARPGEKVSVSVAGASALKRPLSLKAWRPGAGDVIF